MTQKTNSIFSHMESLHPHMGTAWIAAQVAGNIIRDGYLAPEEMSILAKDEMDKVTSIDFNAERAALYVIIGRDPHTAILSEETRPVGDDANALWLLDPLDGTMAFIARCGPHIPSVIIARREQQKTVLGIVYFPITEEWFYAALGKGAFKNGVPLNTKKCKWKLKNTWANYHPYANATYETEQFVRIQKQLRTPPHHALLLTAQPPHAGAYVRILENQSKFGVIIQDCNPHNKMPKPWDVAAPQLIIEEAGGVVVNIFGESCSPFEDQVRIIARTPKLAKEIYSKI